MKKNESFEGFNPDEFDDRLVIYIKDIASNEAARKMHAREKIVEIGEEVLDDIRKLISVKNKVIRWEIAKILQQIKSEKSIPDLIQLLEDDESDIRWIAAKGLIHIGRKTILPLLEEIINDSDSEFLRSGAHHTLMGLFTREEKKKYKSLLHALKSSAIAGDVVAFEAIKLIDDLNKQ